MRTWKHGIGLVAAVLLAWPLANGALFAQHGHGGGDHGGGGHDGGGGGDHDGGAQNSIGGDRGDGGGRSFSDGARAFSGGDRGGNRGDGNGASARSFSGGQERNRSGQQSRRSFYRGPDDGQRSEAFQQFSRDRLQDGDRNRNERNQSARGRDFDRSDFNRYLGGNGRDDSRWNNDVRNNWWRNNDRNNIPFRSSWWNGFYGDNWPVYSPYRYSRWSNRPNYWWGYTTAPLLTNYLVFGFDRPRYWSYGPGANIYYQDDYVYYDNRRTIPVNDYYRQIYDLAHSVPNISQSEAESMDWSPLGVFAVGRNPDAGSQRALQMAINKEGVVTGTYFNRETNEVHPVSGMVDERTQRAAWAFADGTQKNVVFETALYNLTRDQSTMMVHFGPNAGDTEVWHLVRLEQPDSTGNAAMPQQQSATRTLP
jgi:hypothetical protein